MMKLYKKTGLLLAGLALLGILFLISSGRLSTFSPKDALTSVLNTENIISLTNKSRASAGLRPLALNLKLQSAAQKKADEMLANQYFAHTSPSGKTAWDFLDDAGYDFLFAGENLAMNFRSAEETLLGWLTSQKHKDNITDKNYTQIGIGVSAGKFLGTETTVVVQMFGQPLAKTGALSKKKMARSAKKPLKIRGSSPKQYISRLIQNNAAQWIPSAPTHQIYGPTGKRIPRTQTINIFLLSGAVSGLIAVAYNRLRKPKN